MLNLRPEQTSAKNRSESQQDHVWNWPSPAPGPKRPDQPWPRISLATALCLLSARGPTSLCPEPASACRSLYDFQDTAAVASFPIASNPHTTFVLFGLLSLSNTWYMSTFFTQSPDDPASFEGAQTGAASCHTHE